MNEQPRYDDPREARTVSDAERWLRRRGVGNGINERWETARALLDLRTLVEHGKIAKG